YVIVLAWRLAINDIFTTADDGVAASRAARADTFRFLQKPNTHFKSEIGRSERADWTDVDRIERVIVLESFAGMRSQHGVTAAIDKAEHIVLYDLVTKSNASRTENAALIIKRHARSDLNSFRFFDFV